MVENKNVFWQALLLTVILFGIGLVLGFVLESNRTNRVELNLLESEISLLDQQVRNRGIDQFSIDCDTAKQSTFSFADQIYQEALRLEKYDSSSKFLDTLKIIHKRYDLLRMILWMESIDLKDRCSQNINTVIYLFEYASEEIDTKAKQASISRMLFDLKNKHGDKIILIPIAGNLDLESINLLKKKYSIENMPALIINEEKVVDSEITFAELEKITLETTGFEDLNGIVFRKVEFSNPEGIIVLN